MTSYKIRTDRTLQEIPEYPQSAFPLVVWQDNYAAFYGHAVNAHWHDDFEISLVTAGQVAYNVSDETVMLSAGDCMFINSGVLHMMEQIGDTPAVVIGITFKPRVFFADTDSVLYKRLFETMIDSNIKGFAIDTTVPHGKDIATHLRAASALPRGEGGYELRVLSVVADLWCHLLSYYKERFGDFIPEGAPSRREDDVKRILSFIKAHFAEQLTVADIAKAVGISRSECFKSFRFFTFKTPMEYILDYRLTRAAAMLYETDDTVLQICTRCGFSNSSYFGKRFRERYGVTPLAYRKKRRAQ